MWNGRIYGVVRDMSCDYGMIGVLRRQTLGKSRWITVTLKPRKTGHSVEQRGRVAGGELGSYLRTGELYGNG